MDSVNSPPWATLRSVGTPYHIPLTQSPFVIGRNPTSDFVSSNPCLSSVHCVLSHDPTTGKAYLMDSSSNGCAVNGTRLGRGVARELHEGDTIDLVDCRSPKHEPYRLRYEVRDLVPRAEGQPERRPLINLGIPPRRLGDAYLISSICLGRGHYAEVWRAVRRSDNVPVAVKTISKKKIGTQESDPAPGGAMDREALILKKISHESVVSVLDVFETSEHVHLVLELCSGGDLFEHLQALKGSYGLPEEQARDYFYQIAQAVLYLHRLGIVHRDLKPENILLTQDTRVVKVTDFGLAKVFAAMSQGSKNLLTTICGTPLYVAPEVVEADRRTEEGNAYTSNVDVWSLGVVLWVMLTKRVPLQRIRDKLGRCTKRLDYSVPLDFSLSIFGGVSAECKDLLAKTLCVDPKVRLDMEGVVGHPWLSNVAQSASTKKRARD